MSVKLIKNDEDHKAALSRIEKLWGSAPGTPEGDELELLFHLVEAYEEEHHSIPMPDPVSAIRFRMEQQGLKAGDLIPYIGSKSKVSEVLNGKRPLSLAMIRKLHAELGIPLEVLVQEAPCQPAPEFEGTEWSEFPLREMASRGWFGAAVLNARDLLEKAEEVLGGFLKPPGMPSPEAVLCRQSPTSKRKTDHRALWTWQARVWQLAQQQRTEPFKDGLLSVQAMGEIARLSTLDNGPLVARDMLAKMGIRLVFEPSLPRTYLDGAAIRGTDGTVVIAMTLRHDRLDNFWFTLEHELAHLLLHLNKPTGGAILDDLECPDSDQRELEADATARDAMIPQDAWSHFTSKRNISKSEIIELATLHRVHPCIPAGRLRHERKNFKLFDALVGRGTIRGLFLQ